MPRGKKNLSDFNVPTVGKPASKQPYKEKKTAEWGGYLNVRLSADAADEFFEWLPKAQLDEGWAFLAKAIQDGIKLSVVYDDEHDAFIATFTGALTGDPSVRQSMSSRGEHWSTAVLLQAYKHAVILKGDYTGLQSKDEGWMRFG